MDGGGKHDRSGDAAGEATPGSAKQDFAPPEPDLAALARDWIELWQSELAALAADREAAETWVRLAALWAGLAASAVAAMPRGAGEEGRDGFGAFGFPGGFPGGFTGPAHAPRPAPAAAAPDPGGLASHRLLERVLDRLDAIERRLSAMEERSGGGAGGGGRPRARRRGD